MKIINRTLPLLLICLSGNELQAQVPPERIVRTYHVIEVRQGETLYSLSRAFNIPVEAIKKANPGLAQDSILRVGREIVIPVIPPPKAGTNVPAPPQSVTPAPPDRFNSNPFDKPQSTEPSGTAAEKPATTLPVMQQKAPEGFLYHTVGEKQTLFAISRLYNVSVEDIMKWNNLADNNIRTGMQLLIRSTGSGQTAAGGQPADQWSAEDIKKASAPPAKNSLQESLYQVFLDAQSKGGAPVLERVSIGWVSSENPKMSGSYFCLHKTASVGTVIKLTNLVNKKVAFVKVIGKLPETAENINIMMRVSSSVKNDLLLGGDRAYVESEFYP